MSKNAALGTPHNPPVSTLLSPQGDRGRLRLGS